MVSDGGGQATIASDRLAEAGARACRAQRHHQAAPRRDPFPQASLVNPVDVAGSTDANPALLATCMEIVAEDENVDAVFLVGMFGGYSIRFAEDLLGGEMRERRIDDRARPALHQFAARHLQPHALIKPPALRRLHEGRPAGSPRSNTR